MKWLVRSVAGVVIAVLVLTAFRPGVLFRSSVFAIAAVLYMVGRYEGVDMRKFWGDDDDEPKGPFRPA